jgi:cell division protein FtsB
MSTDNVNRQIEVAKEKIKQAKKQIESLEKTLKKLEDGDSLQSIGHQLTQQHNV